MKINCIHGYFKFEEQMSGELATFASLYGLEFARSGDHFTLSDLVDAPKHSLAGGSFLGCPTTETFEGEPWEVMRANELVYDFVTGAVVPIATIVRSAKLVQCENFFYASGMIVPGSVMEDGKRVKDYAALYLFSTNQFRYSEVNGV